jgi:dephospho-CoA kinase
MQPGEQVYQEVLREFGREILNPDASVNRSKLAEAAFGPPGSDKGPVRVADLNRIVHPAVIRSQEEWMHTIGLQDPGGVAIVEAALLIEAGAAKRFDRLIVVTSTLEQRVERFAKRQKIDLETARAEVARRMAAQLPDEEKIKAADYVIDNSGPLERTSEQVRQIWEKLRTAHESATRPAIHPAK